MISDQKLCSEEASHCSYMEAMSFLFCRNDLIHLGLQLIELSSADRLHRSELEYLLADDRIIEELCLLDILVTYAAHRYLFVL